MRSPSNPPILRQRKPTMTRLDAKFSDASVVSFRLSGEEWPRSALAPVLIPDAWFALLSKPDGRRWIVPSGEDPRPERGDVLTLMRNRAMVVPLEVIDAVSADSFAIRAAAQILVRWPMREDALDAFRRGLFSESPLSLARLCELFSDHGGRRGLQKYVAGHTAESLLGADHTDALADFLRGQMRAVLFENGMEIERVASFRCECPSLQDQLRRRQETSARLERIKAREMVEQAALEAARRRVGELSGLFEKLRAAAGGEGGRWHDLLPALAPNERVRLLENLWRVTPDRETARHVIVVAGYDCIWLNPRELRPIEHRIRFPADLGKARSVCFANESLWVGAADGVWRLSPADGEIRGCFRVSGATGARTGFNAVAVQNGRLYATHSQYGVWSWSLDAGDGRAEFAPSDGMPRRIRCCTSDERGVYFAADDRVLLLNPGHAPECIAAVGRGEIRAMAIVNDEVYLGTDEGMLLRDRIDGTQGVCECLYRAPAAIETIAARRWSDMTELVFPAGMDGVLNLFAEEGVCGRLLESSHQVIRRAWVADDLIVAMRDLRDRLILLHADEPSRGGRTISMIDLLGREIEDACIVTAPPEPHPPA